MKKYMVISHASQEAMMKMPEKSPEEMQEGMKKWFDWKDKFEPQVVDMGAPVFGGVIVSPDGSTVPSTKDMAGYMMIEADDLEAAIKLLQESPLFGEFEGAQVELHEVMDMQ